MKNWPKFENLVKIWIFGNFEKIWSKLKKLAEIFQKFVKIENFGQNLKTLLKFKNVVKIYFPVAKQEYPTKFEKKLRISVSRSIPSGKHSGSS